MKRHLITGLILASGAVFAQDSTLSANKTGNLIIIPELRLDNASENIF
jgi:hypothetical protein